MTLFFLKQKDRREKTDRKKKWRNISVVMRFEISECTN